MFNDHPHSPQQDERHKVRVYSLEGGCACLRAILIQVGGAVCDPQRNITSPGGLRLGEICVQLERTGSFYVGSDVSALKDGGGDSGRGQQR